MPSFKYRSTVEPVQSSHHVRQPPPHYSHLVKSPSDKTPYIKDLLKAATSLLLLLIFGPWVTTMDICRDAKCCIIGQYLHERRRLSWHRLSPVQHSRLLSCIFQPHHSVLPSVASVGFANLRASHTNEHMNHCTTGCQSRNFTIQICTCTYTSFCSPLE